MAPPGPRLASDAAAAPRRRRRRLGSLSGQRLGRGQGGEGRRRRPVLLPREWCGEGLGGDRGRQRLLWLARAAAGGPPAVAAGGCGDGGGGSGSSRGIGGGYHHWRVSKEGVREQGGPTPSPWRPIVQNSIPDGWDHPRDWRRPAGRDQHCWVRPSGSTTDPADGRPPVRHGHRGAGCVRSLLASTAASGHHHGPLPPSVAPRPTHAVASLQEGRRRDRCRQTGGRDRGWRE